MNNKKIIFGILLFFAISFIAYTFANPLDEEDGVLTPGNNSNLTNSNNDGDANTNSNTTIDGPVKVDDNDKKDDENTTNVTGTNNTNSTTNRTNSTANTNVTRPTTSITTNNNTTRPQGGQTSNTPSTPSTPSTPTTPDEPTPVKDPEYTINVNVTNGSSNISSKVVKKGETAEFTITPNTGYMLYDTTVSGGCTLNKNVLTIANVTDNVTCNVTLKLEPLYSTISIDNNSINVSQNANTITFTGNIMELEEWAEYDQFDIAQSNIKFTAPRIFTEEELKNLTITIGNKTYGYEHIMNQSEAFAETSKAYFIVALKYQKGDSKSVTIDWGNGKTITYTLIFNINVEKFNKE